MKKFFGFVIAILSMTFLIGQEQVLFDYQAKADVLDTGYDWIENAQTIAYSGSYIPGKNISNPKVTDEYGLAVRTDSAPQFTTSNFAIRFITPQFNDGEGVGVIKNAGAVKSMDITMTLNRGYDEVSVVWLQNGIEHAKKFTAKDVSEPIASMTEFTAHIDFDDYVDDVRNRSTKQIPIAGLTMTNIYLKEIKVTTHAASADWYYSPTCIVGVKKIALVCDKAVTDDAYSQKEQADQVFEVDSDKALRDKTKASIESKARMTAYNQSLMATEESSNSQTSAENAK